MTGTGERPPAKKPAGPKYSSGNPPTRRTVNATELEAVRLKAVQLRLEGKTYFEVAKTLKVNYETARDYVHHMLNKQEKDLVPALRAMEDQRLDTIVQECYRIIQAKPGTELALKAADRLLRAIATRASLHGLNAPVEVSITEHTQMDHEIAGLLQQQEALNQQTHQQIIDGELVGETNATPA